MTKKFENKKLNKEDHAKVDKEAGIARIVTGGGVLGVAAFFLFRKVPWKEVGGTGKKIFKA